MANTYQSLLVHCVFSTKDRRPLITEELRQRLWAFIGGILRQNRMRALCVGGHTDHVHILVSLPTNISVAKAVQLIKGGSSKWIHVSFPEYAEFFWQEGYSAFSVSLSHVDKTMSYIENQAQHHQTRTFKEEYLGFLETHGIDYDERYVFG